MAALKTSGQKLRKRSVFVLFMLCVVGFGICAASLVYVQLIKGGEYREKAANNQLHDTLVSAERGVIYDANMTPLAESTSVKKVYVNAAQIGDNTTARDRIAKELSEILHLSEDYVREKCSQTGYRYVVIKSKVENADAEKVQDFMRTYYEKPGEDGKAQRVYFSTFVGIDPDVKRYYSKPHLASGVLGFTGADDVGLYGIELKYDDVLTGVPGRIITAQNGGTNSRSMPIEYKNVYDAKQGTGLVLTIDEFVQSYLENALQKAYVDTQCDSVLGIIMDGQEAVPKQGRPPQPGHGKDAASTIYPAGVRTIRKGAWRRVDAQGHCRVLHGHRRDSVLLASHCQGVQYCAGFQPDVLFRKRPPQE